jgi:hypothetical protein
MLLFYFILAMNIQVNVVGSITNITRNYKWNFYKKSAKQYNVLTHCK